MKYLKQLFEAFIANRERQSSCLYQRSTLLLLSRCMKCKFLEHGIAIGYDHVVKPCCEWIQDPEWNQQNHISQVDLETWHQSPQVIQIRNQLSQGTWPTACRLCAQVEQNGRQDSVRGNGNHAYADYVDQDITLEIRPGSVCNFACQTCWPAASSRVAQYHHQAGLVNIKTVNSNSIDDFEFLRPIADRIRNVVLLGGEPFYDPSCGKFLAWADAKSTGLNYHVYQWITCGLGLG
jgi:hypothetical protein